MVVQSDVRNMVHARLQGTVLAPKVKDFFLLLITSILKNFKQDSFAHCVKKTTSQIGYEGSTATSVHLFPRKSFPVYLQYVHSKLLTCMKNVVMIHHNKWLAFYHCNSNKLSIWACASNSNETNCLCICKSLGWCTTLHKTSHWTRIVLIHCKCICMHQQHGECDVQYSKPVPSLFSSNESITIVVDFQSPISPKIIKWKVNFENSDFRPDERQSTCS